MAPIFFRARCASMNEHRDRAQAERTRYRSESTKARNPRRAATGVRRQADNTPMTPVVINPVEQIVAARRRLKRVAALRAGLALFVPALTALILAAILRAIGAATWERIGYALAPARLGGLRLACWSRASRRSPDAPDGFAGLARSRRFHGLPPSASTKPSMATRKSLRWRASPALPNLLRSARSRRLCSRCYGAAPPAISNDSIRACAFAFDVRRPLTRSLPLAAVIVVVLAAAALALVRPPTAEQLEAHKLRAAAQELAASPSSADKELAAKILAAANALEIPTFRPARSSNGWPKR